MRLKTLLAIALIGGACLAADFSRADEPRMIDLQTCKDLVFDVNKVANARANDYPKEELHAIVEHSVTNGNIEGARASDINVMIEEAYATKDKAALLEWMKAKVAPCVI